MNLKAVLTVHIKCSIKNLIEYSISKTTVSILVAYGAIPCGAPELLILVLFSTSGIKILY